MDFIILLKYAFLGLLQGFTEPIPISSSGHLVLVQHLFGLYIEGLSFEILVNTASLLAVLIIYREDLIRLTKNGINYILTRKEEYQSDFMFIVYLVIATVPAGVIGVLFNDFISETLKGIYMVGISLLVTAVALWLIRNLRGQKADAHLTWKDAVIVGLAQAVALIPGISRSGATIVAAMALGMKQDTALRFSFLLYIPVSVGGIILEGPKLFSDSGGQGLFLAHTIAFLLSLIASYFSLRWFMGIMRQGNLKYFSYYCVVLGVFILLFL
ncbi:undecaprenyl-diphosphate phosphatase [Ammoniphilus sp. CFH 90114]|uniref:undecaprenyl-diphosphate phosphatase n=1 Tax=Ammoniphilus sp. CFH 90114 TaxID=2493665 RepID=UPI00100F8185|nr:undecaprenyl-diphosphate phosphatase [Ammoniphilus sp. CFH 90114]RXT05252.1 undecaprenyl-diphosphate phosphatase [Ammoniphilus sp. CFH 90114]